MNKIIYFRKKCKFLGIKINHITLIQNAIKPLGGKLFLVGGNVRDLILENNHTTHSDLVCNLPINLIVESLLKKDIRISKVGIEYGSIVAFINNVSFDITSMRKDLKTDGRYAKIQFTTDINQDAKRRDFTINSIYCDTKGILIDPFDGINDLKKKRVKFIGNPENRIKEDYLRILRFLRFSLLYSKKFDLDGFVACKKFQKNIKKLSFERRLSEFGKIITLKNVENTSILKKLISFFEFSLDSRIDLNNFEKLCNLEKKLKKISKTRRIKFLIRNTNKKQNFLSKLDKISRERIKYNFNFTKTSDHKILKEIFKRSEEQIYDNIIISYADEMLTKQRFDYLKKKITELKKKFPLKGADLIKIGFKAGEMLGKVLIEIEDWWIKSKFLPKKKQCIDYAKKKLPSS